MKNIVLILLLAFALGASAQTAKQEIAARPTLSASNHAAYPYPAQPLPRLTAAPAGYEPFYIDHYGRHGSRWSTKSSAYGWPASQLEKAQRNHCLTAKGEQVLAVLRKGVEAGYKRTGELSDVGAEQHQGIAARMYRNFPQVFAGDAQVEARSTIIIRCILSMINETNTLKGLNPRLRVHADASVHDMPWMGWGYGEDTLAVPLRKRMDRYSDSAVAANVHPERLMRVLFSDQNFVADSIKAKKLMSSLFDVAGLLQNHHAFDRQNLLNLFTKQELYDLWRAQNVYWYVHWANAPQNGNRMPYIERGLLQNMVATADSMIVRGGHGADLRFGHETCLLPLACIMELDGVNQSVSDLSKLERQWVNYRIFPMGCNVQLIFYRKPGAPVLVKALLNEREVTLPVSTTQFPYYKWSDLREYYIKKLATPIDWTK